MKLEEMKNVDVTMVSEQDLVDIRDVEIKGSLKQDKRMEDYVRQIKNPYCYKYGDYIVKIGFEDTTVTITERLRELILKAANAV